MLDASEVALISGAFTVAGIIVNRGLDVAQGALRRRSYLLEKREDAYYSWLAAITRLAVLTKEELKAPSVATAKKLRAEAEGHYNLAMRDAWAKLRLFAREQVVNSAQAATRSLLALRDDASSDPGLDAFTEAYMTCLTGMRKDVGSWRVLERIDNAGIALGVASNDRTLVPRWRRVFDR